MVVFRFIDGDTLTVVTYDDTTEVVAEEGRHGVTVGGIDMYEVGALEAENTGIASAHIDDTIVVLAEVAEVEVGAIGKIALHLLTIIAQQALAIGNKPQTAFLVLYHRVYRV